MTDVAKSGRESGNGGKAPFKRPSLILGAAHLAALWALTFAQPMLDLLGENPDFFVARGNSSGQRDHKDDDQRAQAHRRQIGEVLL